MTELITRALVAEQSKNQLSSNRESSSPFKQANEQAAQPRRTAGFPNNEATTLENFLIKDPSVQRVSRESLMSQIPAPPRNTKEMSYTFNTFNPGDNYGSNPS